MTQPSEQLASAIEASIDAVNSALKTLSPRIDAEGPMGPQNMALAAVLRAYGQLLGEEMTAQHLQEVGRMQALITRALKGLPLEPGP